MEQYSYHVEDGQFSFDFRAPLLGNIGDKIKIYDSSPVDEETYEIQETCEIKILEINSETHYVECRGSIE